MLINPRLLSAIIASKFLRQEATKWTYSQHLFARRQIVTAHVSNTVLYTKFGVPVVDTAPLTNEKAYDLLVSLSDDERTALRTALDRYESHKIKEGFVGALANTRWRSRFGRPAKMPALGDVDPTGSYCAVPDDWLKKKLVAIAKPPSYADQQRLFWINAVPFLGFGFLDNFIMIVAGDSIENFFGMFMCISTMAAAGLGNTVSDVVGLGSAVYIERLSEMMGLTAPKLTEYQLDMKASRRAASFGRIMGITVGCLIGMVPLLFIKKKTEEDEKEDNETKEETNPVVAR